MPLDTLEAMAFKAHNENHAEFEKVSERLSKVMGKQLILEYVWCSKCKAFRELKEKNESKQRTQVYTTV